jgi:hypothetical protein
VIYPVELTAKAKDINNEDRDDPKRMEYMKRLNVPVVGLSIGIPRISGKQSKTYQYKINLVKFKELLGADDEYEEIDETIDEE